MLPFQSHLRHLFLSRNSTKRTQPNPAHKTTEVAASASTAAAENNDDNGGGGGDGDDERQRYFHLFNDRLLLLRFSCELAPCIFTLFESFSV